MCQAADFPVLLVFNPGFGVFTNTLTTALQRRPMRQSSVSITSSRVETEAALTTGRNVTELRTVETDRTNSTVVYIYTPALALIYYAPAS